MITWKLETKIILLEHVDTAPPCTTPNDLVAASNSRKKAMTFYSVLPQFHNIYRARTHWGRGGNAQTVDIVEEE